MRVHTNTISSSGKETFRRKTEILTARPSYCPLSIKLIQASNLATPNIAETTTRLDFTNVLPNLVQKIAIQFYPQN